MYAVIESGGKQYRVEKGTVIRVEKMDVPEGEKVVFERVLMASNKGRIYAGPEAGKVKVEGTVTRQGRAKKIIVFRYKPKKGYHRKKGHRQPFTEIRVDKITGGPRASRAKKAKKEVEEVREPEEKAEEKKIKEPEEKADVKKIKEPEEKKTKEPEEKKIKEPEEKAKEKKTQVEAG